MRATQDLSDEPRILSVGCATGKKRADPGPTDRPDAARLRGEQGSGTFAASGHWGRCVSCATRRGGALWRPPRSGGPPRAGPPSRGRARQASGSTSIFAARD
ncbi:MAG: hypothetical protein WCK89_15525, partial [bacterium]